MCRTIFRVMREVFFAPYYTLSKREMKQLVSVTVESRCWYEATLAGTSAGTDLVRAWVFDIS